MAIVTDFTRLPAKSTRCGLSLLLSLMDRTAVRDAPPLFGEKTTLMVQEAAAARLLPQVLVWEKSPGFVPPIEIPPMVSAEIPVLVSVTTWACPRACFPHPSFIGMSFTLPAVTVTCAVTEAEGSVTEAAVRLTAGLAGTKAGAVYVVTAPFAVGDGDTLPQPAVHGVPSCDRVQMTPFAEGSLLTVAANS